MRYENVKICAWKIILPCQLTPFPVFAPSLSHRGSCDRRRSCARLLSHFETRNRSGSYSYSDNEKPIWRTSDVKKAAQRFLPFPLPTFFHLSADGNDSSLVINVKSNCQIFELEWRAREPERRVALPLHPLLFFFADNYENPHILKNMHFSYIPPLNLSTCGCFFTALILFI